MQRSNCLIAGTLMLCLSVSLALAQNAEMADQKIVYPETMKGDVVDDYNGVKVPDPYRWLEDLDSPETAEWVAAQNKITFAFLEQIPAREKIKQRMTKLWDFEKFGIPSREGGRYFFSKNDGLQNQSVVYVAESLEGEPRVLIDPNKLSEDGTVALAGMAISEDGKYMAYGLATAGSDWVEYKVRDIDTGKDLDDHLKWIKFSGASWTKDCKGFYYSRYDEPTGDELEDVNYFQKLFYHSVGTPQSEDKLIYDRPDEKEWSFGGGVTEDGQYLIISIGKGTERKNRVYYQDLKAGDGKTIVLLDDFDAQYGFLGNDGPLFWFFTDLNAPLGRVIAIDTRHPERENWKEIIPQAEETLEGASIVNDTFIASYLKDAHGLVRMFDLEGSHVRDLELPGVGSVYGLGGKRTDTETFYAYSSFSVPMDIYRYDMVTGKSTLFRRPKVDFNPDDFVTKQVFYQQQGRHARAHVHHAQEGPGTQRQQPDLSLRLRRLQHLSYAEVLDQPADPDGDGRRRGDREHPRRRRIRQGLARRRHAAQQAELLRRLHRGGRVAG